MNISPMTELEYQRIVSRLRSSRGLTKIFLLLGMVPVIFGFVRMLNTDFLGMIIFLCVSAFFVLPGIGSFFFSKKLAADVQSQQVNAYEEVITSKYFLSRKAFFSYFIKCGKTAYGVSKETFDRISEHDRVLIRTARYSQELLSLQNATGEEYSLEGTSKNSLLTGLCYEKSI